MNVYVCFPEGKCKALTMSYDDGVDQDARLVEIFNRNGIKGTFNLNYGRIASGGRRAMTPEQLVELYKGHEVATHCLTHPTIARCPLSGVATEIMEDRKGLEKLFGGVVRGHAYPNGSYSEEIKQLFKQLGIAYGRVVPSVPGFKLPADLLEWHPTCHHKDPNLMQMAQSLVESKTWQYAKLMYVWGHSYEFDNDDNWHVIEEFCEYIGGREDIWYATNIEIVDYMEAAERLRFTANNEGVYNPSVQSVWLQHTENAAIIEVKGGTYVDLKAALVK